MNITIKDVAKAANVSPSTVSRVIADSPRISEKTKKKVRKVMEELGYHPISSPEVWQINPPRSSALSFRVRGISPFKTRSSLKCCGVSVKLPTKSITGFN